MSKNTGPRMIELGTMMTLLVPLLYTSGWAYAYRYFDNFHLGLIELSIPKEYLFVFNFWIFRNQFSLALLIIGILFVIHFVVGFFFPKEDPEPEKPKSRLPSPVSRHGRNLFQTMCIVSAPVIVIGLFVLFYHIGNQAGLSSFQNQAQDDFPSYPRVRIWLTEEAKKEAGDMADEWSKGCYRLLLRNENYLYLFYPGKPGDKIPTEVIPADKVRMIRVLPLYHTSKECG